MSGKAIWSFTYYVIVLLVALTVSGELIAAIPVTGPNAISVDEDQTRIISETDFPFSDLDGNTLEGVRIVSIPSQGILSLNATIVVAGQVVSIAELQAGLLRFVPDPDENGIPYTSFTFTVIDDAAEESASATMTINVNPQNDPPTAQDKTLTMDEDQTLVIQTGDFSFNDIDGHAFNKVRIVSTVTLGTLRNGAAVISNNDEVPVADIAAGLLVFTPAPNGNGSPYTTFTFRVFDETGQSSSTHTITLNVNSVNDLPTSVNRSVSIPEDGNKVFEIADFPINDADGDPLASIRISDLNIRGTLQVNSLEVTNNQVITAANIPNMVFTPLPDEFGNNYASFSFEVNDGQVFSATKYLFNINVTAVNDPPTINPIADPAPIFEDAPEQTVTLTGISAGPNETPPPTVSVSSSNTTLIPTPTLNYNSTTGEAIVTYTPAANQFGTAVITVTVNDGNSSVSENWNVTVISINDAPTINAILNQSTNEDTPLIVNMSGISAGAPNESGQFISITATSDNTTVIPNGVINYTQGSATGTISFTPVPDAVGLATITLTLKDDGGKTNPGDEDETIITFTVEVVPVNDPPTLDDIISPAPINEDSPQQTVGLTGISDGDPELNQTLTITAVSDNTNLIETFTVVQSGSTATISYTPKPNAFGTANITVTVSDGELSVSKGFTIIVNAVNDSPTIDPIGPIDPIDEDAPEQVITLTGISPGPNESNQNVTVTATSDKPDIIPNPVVSYDGGTNTWTMRYQPVQDKFGTVIITVTVADDDPDQKFTSVSFTQIVNPVNDPPTLNPISNITIDEDAGLQTIVFNGISDDGDPPLNLTVTATSSNTAIIPNGNINVSYTSPGTSGSLTFQAGNNRFGVVTITVRVTDKEGVFTEQSFSVEILNINDPPAMNDIPTPSAIPEDAPLQTITLTGINAGPFETEPLIASVSAANPSLFQVLSVSLSGATGTLSYQPAPNANGSTLVTVRLDDQLGSNSITEKSVTITILAVNDPPSFDIPAVYAISENSGFQTVAAFATNISDGDPEDQILSFNINPGTPTGNLSFISPPAIDVTTGNLTFEAAPNTNGSVAVQVTLIDNGGTVNGGINQVTKSFTLFITAVNMPPTFSLNGNPPEVNEGVGAVSVPAFAQNIDDGDPELSQELEFEITQVTGNVTFSNFPAISVTTGNLTYTPETNSNGSAIFNVVLRETATSLTSTTQQFTIVVNAVNDPPVGADETVVMNEDETYTFGQSDFTFSDVDGHAFAGVQINSLPLNGNLRYNGASVSIGSIYQNVSLLTFTPNEDESGSPYASFTFRVRDDSGDLSISTYTMNVNVNPVPDNPRSASSFVSTLENQNYTFAVSDFQFSDPDGDAFNGIIIRSNVDKGSLEENNVPITTFPATVEDVTKLVFIPLAGESGTPYTNFTFDVVDSENATSEGQDGSPYTMSINVGPVSDPPTGSDGTINMLEDQIYTFQVTDFAFNDPDGDNFAGIQITQVETSGTLKYDGVDVVALGNYPDVTKLTYQPPSNQNGNALSFFRFRVRDDSDEINISINSYTMTFNVAAVNDAPVFTITENPPAVNEDTGAQTVEGFVTSIDDGDNEVTQVLNFTLTVPDHPTLSFSTLPQINANTGDLTYTPAPDAYGSVTITVLLRDNGGTANGGSDESESQQFTITVNPVNDPPTLSDITGPFVVNEDASPFNVNLSGISAGPANESSQTISVSAASSNTAIIPNPVVNYSSPNTTGNLAITPVPNASGTATITVTVSDGQSANSTVIRTFQVTVNPVNDPPTLNPIENPAPVFEDAGVQTINLSGITAGPNESQPLVVTATSDNETLISNSSININYTSPNSIGSISYTPAANRWGTATITVVVQDDGTENNTFQRSFTVSVQPVNDPPTMNNLPSSPILIDEDAPTQTLTLTGISAGPFETEPVTVTAVSNNPTLIPNPTVGSISNGEAVLSFTPSPNQSGTAIITVTVNDGQAENNIVSRNFTVEVRSVNDPPTLDPITGSPFTINEDAPMQTITLTGISAGGGEDQFLEIYAISGSPAIIKNPTINFTQGSSTATLSYIPEPDKSGSVTIEVFVDDLSPVNNLTSRTFIVNVTEINDFPTINDIVSPLNILEDAPPQNVALSGITAGGGENQTVIVTAQETGGANIINTITVNYSGNNNATLIFSVKPNANGTTTIEVTVDDQQAVNNITRKSFVVNVQKVNDPPTLDPIASPYNINEDAGTQTIELTGITPGPLEDEQNVTITAVSSNTSLIPNPTINAKTATTRDLVFTPIANRNGSSTITVTVNDGESSNNLVSRSFIVNITAVNDPPAFDIPASLTIQENAGPQVVSAFATNINDGDPEVTQILTFNLTAGGNLVFKTLPTISPANGNLTYEIAKDSNGESEVTVTLTDNGVPPASTQKTFKLIVLPVNGAPSFSLIGNPPATNEDAGLIVVPNFARDIDDGDPELDQSEDLVFIVQKISGALNFSTPPSIDPSTGDLSYESFPNDFGSAIFSAILNDGGANSLAQFFTITVNPVNDPPVGANDKITTAEDVAYTFKTSDFTFSDIDGDEFNGIVIVSLPAKGRLEFNGTPVMVNQICPDVTRLVFRPDANGNGDPYTSFEFRLRDSALQLSGIYTMNITVTPVDDNPTSANSEVNTLENVTYTFKEDDFEFNDVDGDDFTGVRIYSLPDRGSLKYNGADVSVGTIITNFSVFQFIPAPNASGSPYTTFQFQVRDSKNALSQEYTMSIVVGPVNDRPTGADKTITLLEDQIYTFIASEFTFNDLDGHLFDGVRVETLPAAGTLRYNGTVISSTPFLCTNVTILTFSPAANMNGTPYTTFTFKVKDNSSSFNLSESNYTMTINVTPVNDPPVFTIASNPPASNEDTGLQTIANFASGISDGDPEVSQTLQFNTPVLISSTGSLTFSVQPSISPAGVLTYQAAANRYGTATFSVTLSDNGGTANGGQNTSVAHNFTITVNNINDPPTMNPIPDPAAINEDADTQTVNFSGVTAGPFENQTLTITATSSNTTLIPTPTVNYSSPNTTGSVSYKPAPDQSGTATITLRVNDGGSINNSVERSFVVRVNPVNDPPTINPIPDPNPIPENSGLQVITITGISAGGGENQTVILSVTSSNTVLIPTPQITYSGGSTAQLTYTPAPNTSGVSTITVTANDQNGGITQRTFTVRVSDINDPPTINPVPNPNPIPEDSGLQTITLSGISPGVNEDQVLTITARSSNEALISSININYSNQASTAQLSYTPNPNQFGTALITVTVDDGDPVNGQVSVQFTVTVFPVADTPSVTGATTNQGAQTTSGLVISRNVNDGSEVRYFRITNVQNGTLYLQNGTTQIINGEYITYENGNAGLRFTPNSTMNGSFGIQASLTDEPAGLGGSVITATIIVNSTPTVKDLFSSLSVEEDSPDINLNLFQYFDDEEDPDEDLIFSINNTAPSIVNASINGNTLRIQFLENQHGTAFITIRCTDKQGAFVEHVLQITVLPVNDAPEIISTPVQSVEQDELYEYLITTLDVEGDDRYFDWIAPEWLFLTDNGDGTALLSGTPDNNDVGIADVEIRVIETLSGLSDTQAFTIQVINVNDPPKFVSTPPTEVEETKKYEYNIVIEDPDVDDSYEVTIDLTTRPSWLILSTNAPYTLEGFPPVGSAGTYPIKLIVWDAAAASDEQEFTIIVSAPNLPPTLSGSFTIQLEEDADFTFNPQTFIARFQDQDPNDALNFIIFTELPSNGTLSLNGSVISTTDTIQVEEIQNLVYTPNPDFFGSDFCVWKASDGKAISLNDSRINITITPVDDPPRILNMETNPVTYAFGDFNVHLTQTAEVIEVDDGRIFSARASIISGYNQQEDSLAIDLFDGIITNWNDTTGTLNISGVRNAQLYQEIIRSLIYINQRRLTPNSQNRTVEIIASDGILSSEPVTRVIDFEDTFIELSIPSGFTPNEDNANDTWEIDNIMEHDDAIVRVYSREGNLIYESIGIYKEWDGKYRGEYVKADVYYYTIAIPKYERKYKGSITVLR